MTRRPVTSAHQPVARTMHTFLRFLFASIAALPFVAQAWAPLYTTASDAPCTWPQPATVTLVGNFAGKTDPAGTTWNNIVAEAAAAWNTQMKDAQLVATEGIGSAGTRENGVNELFFADTAFGFEFGDATSLSFVVKSADRLVESDVVFKRSHTWDAAGFRTAATHELGHTLGLGHPDQAGQTVVALMNGNSVNSLTLAADDIAGIQFLYGAPPQPPSAPAITTQPASRSALLGSSVSFTITANGFPIPTFQWQKDGTPIPGATAATLTIFPVTASAAGAYRVVATNSEGSATSVAATLTVNVPPSIVSAPVARIVPVGETVTFSVIAAGDAPLSYQWAFNGADIPGATAASHAVSVSDVTVGIYRVMVTNPFGSASASATLAIQPPFSAPAITTQPTDLTVNAGSTATFTVEATGFPRPVCQWLKDGVTLAGVLGTTLVLDNVQASQAGSYRAVLTNSAGSVTSEVATLIVNTQGPAIATQPADLVATEGTAVELAVVATGFPPPSYRWSKDGRVLADAHSAKLAFAAIGMADAGLYSVEVYNELGTVTSRSAVVSVQRAPAAPVITVQPPNRTVSLGGDVSFAVGATGYPAPTYQWYKNEAPILNATAASLVITNAQNSDAGRYYVIATNASGTARSESATLVVSSEPSAPRISAQPQSQVSPVGANVTFTVVADGLPKPTYQWKKDGLNITGATGASLVIPGVQTGAAGAYSVVVTNSHGQLTSDTATLVVHTAPTIVTQPAAQTVAAGTPVSFTVGATGIPAPTYQWRKSGVAIPGATEATLAIANAQPEHAGNYVVVVTNSSGTVTSNSVALIVNTPPSIGTEPADVSVLAGTEVDFSVVAAGTAPLTYQWYLNGALAEGHNAASFGSFAASGYHDGYTFKCIVTNALGFATSRTATLHVGVPTAPTITAEPVDVIAKVGDTADFVVEAAGVPDPTYRWYLNGVLAAGHTKAAFGAFTVDGFHDNYTFRCVVTNPSGSATTRIARLYVGTASAPAVLAEPVDLQAKVGDTVDFTASFSGLPPPTYRWEMNGNPVDGRTAANFGAFKVEAYHNGYTFRCVATNASGTVSTRIATLTVATPAAPTIMTQPASRTVKLGDAVDFSVVASGYPAPTYQWYLNGTLVADRTGPQFGSFTADGYHDGYTFKCVVTNEHGSVTSQTATLRIAFPPTVAVQSTGVAVTDGQPASLVLNATGATRFQWFRGGILVADQQHHGGVLLSDGERITLDLPTMTPAHAGLYDCMASGPGGDRLSAPIVLGVLPAAGQRTAGSVATRTEWQNLRHASGAILDQFLLSGAAGTFTADPGEVARMSFLDENGSIVQVELSGAGAITVVLEGAVGPQSPALYNQPGVAYMKGKATVILAGANETTHFTIYSVGTATNPGVTRADADYVGWADVAASGIVSTDGKLGGIHQGNVAYSSDLGPTGLYAPSVTQVIGNVVVHGVAASESAQSYLQFAPTGEIDVLIAGSDLAQGNDGGIVVDGIHRVLGNAGQDSCGRNAPPQNIATTLFTPEGEDVTGDLFFPVIIVGPGGLPPLPPIVPDPVVVPGS